MEIPWNETAHTYSDLSHSLQGQWDKDFQQYQKNLAIYVNMLQATRVTTETADFLTQWWGHTWNKLKSWFNPFNLLNMTCIVIILLLTTSIIKCMLTRL
jgi:hypothetical protein